MRALFAQALLLFLLLLLLPWHLLWCATGLTVQQVISINPEVGVDTNSPSFLPLTHIPPRLAQHSNGAAGQPIDNRLRCGWGWGSALAVGPYSPAVQLQTGQKLHSFCSTASAFCPPKAPVCISQNALRACEEGVSTRQRAQPREFLLAWINALRLILLQCTETNTITGQPVLVLEEILECVYL